MSKRRATSIIQGMPTTDGAGVVLNRVIGSTKLNMLDPFLLLDEFKSTEHVAGFPPHPHRGFETVTYMLAGQVKHKDNLGHSGTVGPGGVQWMTAGKGVIHSEMPVPKKGLVHGFQLWVNLPSKEKMKAPRYHEFAADEIPKETRGQGVYVRVIAGNTNQGTQGPVAGIVTKPLYLDVSLQNNSTFVEKIPQSHGAFVFVIKGKLLIADDDAKSSQLISKGSLAVLGEGDQVHIEGLKDDTQFLLVAAKRLNESVARHGPFVMNTNAELMQAVTDYQNGNF